MEGTEAPEASCDAAPGASPLKLFAMSHILAVQELNRQASENKAREEGRSGPAVISRPVISLPAKEMTVEERAASDASGQASARALSDENSAKWKAERLGPNAAADVGPPTPKLFKKKKRGDKNGERVPCIDCGETFKNDHGLWLHQGRDSNLCGAAGISKRAREQERSAWPLITGMRDARTPEERRDAVDERQLNLPGSSAYTLVNPTALTPGPKSWTPKP
jgi:hypothetical protein